MVMAVHRVNAMKYTPKNGYNGKFSVMYILHPLLPPPKKV